MAAKVISDNPFEIELQKNRALLEGTSKDVTAFMSNFLNLPPKERAKILRSIQSRLAQLQNFLRQNHAQHLTTASVRFQLENIKSGHSSLMGRWTKFERSLGG